jgi:hypothetical protein
MAKRYEYAAGPTPEIKGDSPHLQLQTRLRPPPPATIDDAVVRFWTAAQTQACEICGARRPTRLIHGVHVCGPSCANIVAHREYDRLQAISCTPDRASFIASLPHLSCYSALVGAVAK